MRKPLLFKLPAWYALAAVFLLSAIIYSCKKDQHLTQNTLTPETAAAKMQSWLAQEKTDSLSGITITNLLNNADWKTAHTLTADTGRVYLTVKLNYLPTFDDPDKTEDRYLTLLVQNGNTTGYIYDLYGNKTDIAGKGDDAITLFNQNNMPGFTGEVTVSSWKNVVKELKVFTNGAMVSYGKVTAQASSKAIQSMVKVNQCDDYYWLVKDGSGTILAAYYLFTVCNGSGNDGGNCGQEPYAFRGSKGTLTVRTNCGGGGGGGAGPGDANGTVTAYQAKLNDLADSLEQNHSFLLDCETVKKFKSLASYIPPQELTDRLYSLNQNTTYTTLFSKPYFIQQIQNAAGYEINLDRFEININQLPTIGGTQVTAAQFLNYIRLNINSFINTDIVTFQPYIDPDDNIDDTNKWLSNTPQDAILHLNMADDGSVVVSDISNDHWTVSTLRTPIDGAHPVSGNRKWGYQINSNNTYTFYVMGVDRLTTGRQELLQYFTGVPFAKADELWESYQSKVNNFVNSHSGQASIGAEIREA